MMDDPIKLLDQFLKRRRFQLMAIGASHAKLGSSINICEARDKRKQQLVENRASHPFVRAPFNPKARNLLASKQPFRSLGAYFCL
jgi:hypothetical protein